ncbi:hypothetical protein ABIB83_008838 [Bradyrhizobium sp. I1.8.5]
MLGQAKVLRGLRRARCHDGPAGPAATDVIQRGEQPRQIVRLSIGRRCSRDQADPLGGGGDRGEQGDRLEPEPLRIADIVRQRRAVGEEDRVELVRFIALRQLLIIGDVENAIGCRTPVAPGSLVMTVWIDKEVEGKLPPFDHL